MNRSFPRRRPARLTRPAAGLFVALGLGCAAPAPEQDRGSPARAVGALAADSGFAAVADSAWIAVTGPTMVGFYPVVTNEQLQADEGLATVLDDFAYHIGTAIDSLVANGYAVHYRGGDTLWLRAGARRWRVTRPADSADVGYLFTDQRGRQTMLFGVRSYLDLIEEAHNFLSSPARPR